MERTATALAEPTIACPRCGKPLTDPAGMGWCQSCGFCRSLEEEKSKRPEPEAKAAPKAAAWAAAPADQEPFRIPRWPILLVIGMAGFAGATLLPARSLPSGPTFERALWTTVQIGSGLLLIFIAQFVALVRIAPEDEKMGFKDALMPFRLWGQVFKRLPALRVPVWLAGWGLSLILSAMIFVGGLGHWMTYLPGGKNNAATNAKKGPR